MSEESTHDSLLDILLISRATMKGVEWGVGSGVGPIL